MSLAGDIDSGNSNWVQGGLSHALHNTIHFPFDALIVALAIFGLYISYHLISGLFFCPLGHVPGPFVTRFGQWYYQYSLITGSITTDLIALHEKYGKQLHEQH
jgi:hypothetical protein